MKTLTFWIAVLFCGAVVAGAVTRNGTFESADSQGRPTAWRLSGDAKVASGAGCGGSAGLVLRGMKKPARATQDVDIEPGKIYLLSADVKNSGGEACVFAEWFDEGGKWKGGFYVKRVANTGGEWRHVRVLSKPMRPGVRKLRVQAQHKSDAPCEAVVDNLVLEEYVLPPPPDADNVHDRYRDGGNAGARVRIDGKNRAIVDGKPFFPLGLYGGIAPEDIGRVADSAFNTLMVYSAPNATALDRAKRYGLKVIAGINHVWADNPYRPASVRTPEDAERWLGGYVAGLRSHDALLAWYIYDEPPINEVQSFVVRRRLMEKLDPDHPCWGALNVPELTAWYLDAFDVAGADPYPISREPMSMVTDWTLRVREGVKGQRAMWMIPQIFDYRNYGRTDSHVPTRDEIRNMTWQCIVGGANGIIYFKYGDLAKNPSGEATFESRWADVRTVAQEVKDFFPMLLSDEDAPTVEVSGDGNVRARAFRFNGEIWIAAVNLTNIEASATLNVGGVSEMRWMGPLGVEVFRVGHRLAYVAHQGEELLAPSHTAAAYRLAVEHGLDYMKLDVHETRDGVIVTQHDADLKRTYGIDAAIRDSDYAALAKLKALPVGAYSNETICTLSNALEIARPMKGVWIDFKQFSPDFMDRVFRAVDASGVPMEKMTVATFNHWALKWAWRKRPGIRLVAHTQIRKVDGGYALNYGEKGKVYANEEALADAIVAYAKKMHLYGVNMPAAHKWRKDRYATTPEMVARLRSAGLWVSIWFVNDPDLGALYRNAGADAFVTGCAALTQRDASGAVDKSADRVAWMLQTNLLARTEAGAVTGLPNVLLLGDSISMGYTPFVKRRLSGVANVSRPKCNCGATQFYLRPKNGMKDWVGTNRWDVIVMNAGIWDICYMKGDVLKTDHYWGPDAELAKLPPLRRGTAIRDRGFHVRTPILEYAANLREILSFLKSTGAAVVFPLTTPCPSYQYDDRCGLFRVYNEVASGVCRELDVPTVDLYAVGERNYDNQPDGAHYNDIGNDLLAEAVAKAVRSALAASIDVGK